MKPTARLVISSFLMSYLVAGACGSVSPLGVDGGAGKSGTGQAGASGGAGTTGGAGTGAAGTMGAAGTTGTAGHGGTGGMSGRVPQKHRAAAIACSLDRPAGSCLNLPDAGSMCRSDAECAAGSNGRCLSVMHGIGCTCTYDTCTTDADCTTGGPCQCRPDAQSNGQGIVAPVAPATNVCMAGNCRVDADCGGGGYCSPSLGTCGNYGGVVGYYCHTTKDKCVDDGDCAAQGGGDCRYDQTTSAWACATSQCVG